MLQPSMLIQIESAVFRPTVLLPPAQPCTAYHLGSHLVVVIDHLGIASRSVHTLQQSRPVIRPPSADLVPETCGIYIDGGEMPCLIVPSSRLWKRQATKADVHVKNERLRWAISLQCGDILAISLTRDCVCGGGFTTFKLTGQDKTGIRGWNTAGLGSLDLLTDVDHYSLSHSPRKLQSPTKSSHFSHIVVSSPSTLRAYHRSTPRVARKKVSSRTAA
jgi:hypothetical protein